MMRKKIGIGLSVLFLAVGLKFLLTSPSHDRTWILEQAVLPSATISGDELVVQNIRDFHLDDAGELVPAYVDRTYDLREIEGADFVFSRFSDAESVAHTFVTFRFENEEPIAISIEARREQGEEYSPLKGLFQAFEEIYVVGTERDLIGLRSHIKNERVYVFEGVTTPQKSRELLVSMLEYANGLVENPTFYNTLTNQCTSKLARHIRSVSDRKLPLSYKILLPGYSDRMAYDLGFIRNDVSFEELKFQSLIDPTVVDLNDPDFSKKIR